MVRTKVVIFGAFPPPVGGVSIHVSRFFELFPMDGFSLEVIDLKKMMVHSHQSDKFGWLDVIKSFLFSKIVHVQVSNQIKILLVLISRLFLKKVVYTHHNSVISNQMAFQILGILCNHIIFVNGAGVGERVLSRLNGKFSIIPAFLPPRRFQSLPPYIDDLVTSHKFTVVANCFRHTYVDDAQVYGFDLILDAFFYLARDKAIEGALFILVDPSGTARGYIEERLKNSVSSSNLLIYVDSPIDYSLLLKKSSLSLRPTRTDGDSLSVRESIWFGTPVIASDVTVRPPGTILFENGNSADLAMKIGSFAERPYRIKGQEKEFWRDVVDIYKRLEGMVQ